MSKAFTKESDHAPEDRPLLPRTPLPFGVRNYMTEAGAARFQADLKNLVEQRSNLIKTEGLTSPSVLSVDQKIQRLNEILTSAVVVTTPSDKVKVRFGDQVQVRDSSGEETLYQLVGVDETDIDSGAISWISPLAKALMGKSRGDTATFTTPAGVQNLTILDIR